MPASGIFYSLENDSICKIGFAKHGRVDFNFIASASFLLFMWSNKFNTVISFDSIFLAADTTIYKTIDSGKAIILVPSAITAQKPMISDSYWACTIINTTGTWTFSILGSLSIPSGTPHIQTF